MMGGNLMPMLPTRLGVGATREGPSCRGQWVPTATRDEGGRSHCPAIAKAMFASAHSPPQAAGGVMIAREREPRPIHNPERETVWYHDRKGKL